MRQPFSMYRRENGVWYYTCYSPSGKRVYRSTGTTKKTEACMIVMERYRTDTLIQKPETSLARFRDLAQGFWDYDTCPIIQEKLARGGTYTRRSALDNERMTENRLVPAFGDTYLCDITPMMVRKWVLDTAKDFSAKSINNWLLVFRQMLDEAVFRKLIPSNPARAIKPLIQKRSGRGCFTSEQVKRILDCCDNEKLRMMVALAAKTGMRQGEIRALTVEQIKDRYILVDASYSRVDGRKCTKAGYSRIVPIDPVFRAKLLAFAPCPEGMLFTNNGAVPVSCQWIGRKFTQAMEKAGIDWREEKLSFHSLRHFANTVMLSGGIAPDLVRKIIGHTTEAMTENYLHVDETTINAVSFIQSAI